MDQKPFIHLKLKFLVEVRNFLHQAVDDHSNQVFTISEAWLKDPDSQSMSEEELNDLINGCIRKLQQMGTDLSDLGVHLAEPQKKNIDETLADAPQSQAGEDETKQPEKSTVAFFTKKNISDLFSKFIEGKFYLASLLFLLIALMIVPCKMASNTAVNLDNVEVSLSTRLQELETKLVDAKENLETKLQKSLERTDRLETDIETASSKLDTHRSPLGIGFTAQLDNKQKASKGVLIFPHVKTNTGGHYSPSAGIFIAPQDGLYLLILLIKMETHYVISGNDFIHASVYHHRAEDGSDFDSKVEVCKADVSEHKTSCTCAGVVSLKKGEKISVEVSDERNSPMMGAVSSFSCASLT